MPKTIKLKHRVREVERLNPELPPQEVDWNDKSILTIVINWNPPKTTLTKMVPWSRMAATLVEVASETPDWVVGNQDAKLLWKRLMDFDWSIFQNLDKVFLFEMLSEIATVLGRQWPPEEEMTEDDDSEDDDAGEASSVDA